MKKKILSVALVLCFLSVLIPVHAAPVFAETAEITSLSLSVTGPRPGQRSTDTAPVVKAEDGPFSIVAVSWLETLSGYSSQEPDLTFLFGETYYVYVLLKADKGYAFQKGKPIFSGVDEGYAEFAGCSVTGGTLEFAASKTYADGDYMRVKLSVKSYPWGISEVVFTVAPPKAGSSATDAMAAVTLADGQNCALTEARWNEQVLDDLFQEFDGTFEEGKTYYLSLEFAADAGYAFNQGGPNGVATVRVTGGTPMHEQLSVMNMMGEDGTLSSFGTVLIAVTAVGNGPDDPTPDDPTPDDPTPDDPTPDDPTPDDPTPDDPTPDDPTPDPLFGDIDFDGKVTASDARLALRRAVGLEAYAQGTNAFLVSDVDFDGKVTASDARLILRGAVGLEDPADWLAAYKKTKE